jgi:4-aminobutyrate aminotransferase
MAHAARGIYFHDFVWDRSKPAIGPFCSDPDGNVILDFSSHGLAFPLGYNNPELVKVATKVAEVNPDRRMG